MKSLLTRLSLVVVFALAMVFANFAPQQSSAFIGWCRKCAVADAAIVLQQPRLTLDDTIELEYTLIEPVKPTLGQ